LSRYESPKDNKSEVEEKSESEYDDDEEDDEQLSAEERKKRRLRRLLKKLEKKYEKGRKVDAGFEGAYASKSWEGIIRHNFHFTPEQKDRAPDIRPTAVSGDNWKEPQRWYPHISQPVEKPDKEEPENKLFRFMEDLSEDERREVWNIFYRQTTGLEEPTEQELARIEERAKLELTTDLKNDAVANEIEAPIDPSFSRTIFDPEPSDADILRAEKLRKLGHGPGKCAPADGLEEGYDV